ncbi:MAG TPA: BamA/TamA family outer membrane protein [Vicinamibacterales bacterium]|nr:BamA/TamA family outer membrane protein [Vicinamibacterales bacterium]
MLQLLLAMMMVRLKADTPVVLAQAPVVSGFSRTAESPEVVTGIRLQGNVLTSDDEMRRLTGIEIGAAFTPDLLDVVASRLKATRKFEEVQVLKRYASIEDASKILLVVIVNEGPVKLETFEDSAEPSHVVRRHGLGLLWMPLLDFEDGYGFSYGVQLARTKILGANSRLSFPLTWGGTRQAGAQLEKIFDGGPLTRVETGATLSGRTNPFYEQDDDRDRLWVRAERAFGTPLRVGATAGWQHVSFMNTTDRFSDVAADVTFDTRLDPMLARNAVYARAAIEHFDFLHAEAATRTEVDGRGYIGLFGQNILVLRALRQDSDVPLPAYLQPMLGGMDNLRGFRAGSAVGDTLVSGTAEIRAPLTSPLSIGKAGVSAFVDIGTIYDKGQHLEDQHFDRGFGGGVWFAATVIHLNLDVAHGVGVGTRVHFGTTLSF